ncbi:MAG: hypothetical protein MUC33_06350 [Desulfobacterales bacterium]|jgi:hypothetical protein|nr:hypothetical protein [Desulfobacterales bacterium]
MTKDPSAVDDRFRSLLQKAVRRGHPELICTVSALIENLNIHSRAWFEKRAAFIVFSECWPLGREMVFTKRFPSKVAALIRVARAHKARDATGLGLLAYAFAKGDASVLNPSMDDRSVKLIAKAIRHPVDFWEWVSAQSADQKCRVLVANAGRYREGGRPHDKAVVQAAAFLAVSSPLPDPTPAPAADAPFPHWVVFDRHTSEGKRALRDVARDLHIPLPQLEWCFYYFEGAAANAEAPSPWWRRYCQWHFERVGMREEEARLLWEPARAQIADALAEDGRRLQNDIYRWKLANREQVDALKREVERFTSHIKELPRDQSQLF